MKRLIFIVGLLVATFSGSAFSQIMCQDNPRKSYWCHMGTPEAGDETLNCLDGNGITNAHDISSGTGHIADHYATAYEITKGCGSIPPTCPPGQVVDPNTGLCSEDPTPFCAPPLIYDPTTKTCVNPYCEDDNCTIRLSKTFDFDVQMGGVKANLYVCEVGFHTLCPTCTQHYLTLNNDPTKKVFTSQTFSEWNAPSNAQVYINDLLFGAEFYVKYCVTASRLVVGDETPVGYAAVITPSVAIWTGKYKNTGYNDYVEHAMLGANVWVDCTTGYPENGNSEQGTLLTPQGFPFTGTTESVKNFTPDTLELCGTPDCDKKTCVYTLKFTEGATCYRDFKCVRGDCKPYEATIHTKFDALVDFNCDNGICGND